MGIGMEKTKPHQLLEIAGRTLLGHQRWVNASPNQGRTIGDLDPW